MQRDSELNVDIDEGSILQDSFKQLDKRVDAIIQQCRQLRKENLSLRSGRDALLREHSKLTERNRLARDRLDSVIGKLRQLEETA